VRAREGQTERDVERLERSQRTIAGGGGNRMDRYDVMTCEEGARRAMNPGWFVSQPVTRLQAPT